MINKVPDYVQRIRVVGVFLMRSGKVINFLLNHSLLTHVVVRSKITGWCTNR
jgi:hypothetical protein